MNLSVQNVSNTSQTNDSWPDLGLSNILFSAWEILSWPFRSAPSPFRKNFSVEKISRLKTPSLAKTVKTWELIAKQKELQTSLFSSDYNKFDDCAWVCGQMANTLSLFASQDVHVCKDDAGKEQGVMISAIRPDGIYIKLLATHPRNIRSSINSEETERAEGAGSALLKFAERRASELKKKVVFLSPLSSAVPFYEKVGYKVNGDFMYKTIAKVERVAAPVIHAEAA